MKKLILVFIFIFGLLYQVAPAQVSEEINQDDLGNVTDEFQELFFKAIKLRAIQNYDQAIETLYKCKKLNANEAVVYVELGKNFVALEDFQKAEENFKQAIAYLEGQQKLETQILLFKVLENKKNYKQAADLAKSLIANGEDYEVELIEVYLQANAYAEALSAIENYEQNRGFSTLTDNFRDAIYNSTKNYDAAITYYQYRVANNPSNEDNYFRLINFYKAQGDTSQLLATAKALEKINPLQDELPFIFSIVYLQENRPEEAFAYSRKVLTNNALDENVKTQLIQAIKKFVTANPTYQDEFLQLLDVAIEEGESSASNQERAEFYLAKDEAKALEFYNKALKDQPNSFELHQKVIVLQLKQNAYKDVLASSEDALSIFPAQAVFYYFKGKALDGLGQYEEAISVLEEGLDYLFETSQLEIDMLQQLTKSYFQLGNNDKSNYYSKRLLDAQQALEKQN